jgi:hypothetical protein
MMLSVVFFAFFDYFGIRLNYNLTMIAKLLRGGAVNFFFASAPIKRVGREAVADLPNINFPTKPKPAEDERLSMDFAADTFSIT